MTPATNSQPELSERYYLDNYKCLVEFVFEHYCDLLSGEEAEFYQRFMALQENSQRLYIRLISRNGQFIRRSKIAYTEIDNTDQTLDDLCNAGFVGDAPVDLIDEWITLFNRQELASVLPIAGQLPQLDSALLTTADLFGTTPLDSLLQSERVVQVNYQLCFVTFQLLFFGNLRQDLSTFVLRDLGVRRFEAYLTDTTALPFTVDHR